MELSQDSPAEPSRLVKTSSPHHSCMEKTIVEAGEAWLEVVLIRGVGEQEEEEEDNEEKK